MSIRQTFKTGWSFSWRFALWNLLTLPLYLTILGILTYFENNPPSTPNSLTPVILLILALFTIDVVIKVYLQGIVFAQVRKKYGQDKSR